MVKYTEKDIVSFGNYLLSSLRGESINSDNSPNADKVNHADLENWKHQLSQSESAGLTDGEKLMGVTFNPSGDPEVNDVKKAFAAVADLVLQKGDPKSSYLYNLTKGNALHNLIDAQMDVVKLLTFKY